MVRVGLDRPQDIPPTIYCSYRWSTLSHISSMTCQEYLSEILCEKETVPITSRCITSSTVDLLSMHFCRLYNRYKMLAGQFWIQLLLGHQIPINNN